MQTTLTIRIDAELKRNAEVAALRNSETLSAVIRQALSDYINRPHPTDGSGDDIDPEWLASLSGHTGGIEVNMMHTAGDLLRDYGLTGIAT